MILFSLPEFNIESLTMNENKLMYALLLAKLQLLMHDYEIIV